MISIPIQQLPNQELGIVLDGLLYEISLHTTNGVLSVTVTRDSVQIVDNARAVAGGPILPYRYEENGNFIFITENYQLPDYTKFNITQDLVYFSAAELAVIRTPKAPPITAADFNPIAALPQRFSPQGY